MQRRAPLAVALALRAAGAAALAYAAGSLLRPHPVWAPVSALIVLQGTAATTLGAIANRIGGTLLGAAVAIAVGFALGRADAPMVLQVAVAVALTTLAVTPKPAARVATWTSVIVLMGSVAPGHPLANAAWRIAEVALGAAVGGVVGALVVPLPARRAFQLEVASALRAMAGYVRTAVARTDLSNLAADPHAIHARVSRCEVLADEARRERAQVGWRSDPVDAAHALRRLWHSVVVFRRAAASPVPDSARGELEPAVRDAADRLAAQLDRLGRAADNGASPPEPVRLTSAVSVVADAVSRLRRADVLRAMPDDEAESVWLRRFALDRAAADAEELRAQLVDAAAVSRDDE